MHVVQVKKDVKKKTIYSVRGTRTTIAITMLVRNPDSDEHGVIRYRDVGDYLTREDKLHILTEVNERDPEWVVLQLDKHGDWLDQRDDSFNEFIPLGVQEGTKKTPNGLFATWSAGVKTNRDAWCYNSNRERLCGNTELMVATYKSEPARWKKSDKTVDVKAFPTFDETRIKWT